MKCSNCGKNISFSYKFDLVTWKKVDCTSCKSHWKVKHIHYLGLLLIATIFSLWVGRLDIIFHLQLVLIFISYIFAIYLCPIKTERNTDAE
ncbi:conserved hypothetical protein [Vibrio harveyi]|nr:conserved hypothetical protein [Vibrio harveyi]